MLRGKNCLKKKKFSCSLCKGMPATKYCYLLTYNPEFDLQHTELILLEEFCNNNCARYVMVEETGSLGKRHVHIYMEMNKYSRTNVLRDAIYKIGLTTNTKIAVDIRDKNCYRVATLGYVMKEGNVFSSNIETEELEAAVRTREINEKKKEKPQKEKVLTDKNIWHSIERWRPFDYEYTSWMKLMQDMKQDGWECAYFLMKANVRKCNDIYLWKYNEGDTPTDELNWKIYRWSKKPEDEFQV